MCLGVHVGDCCHQVLDSDGKVEELGVAVFTNWRECSHLGHQALGDYIWSPVTHLERAYDVWYIVWYRQKCMDHVLGCAFEAPLESGQIVGVGEATCRGGGVVQRFEHRPFLR